MPRTLRLINTPNYPDYTSSRNNVAGAHDSPCWSLFFETDRIDVTIAVPQAVRKTRTYYRSPDAADDMVAGTVPLILFCFCGRPQAGSRLDRQSLPAAAAPLVT